MPSVIRNDAAIHYEVHGEGPPMVFIPGTGLRGSSWQPQTDHFRQNFTCVTLDLRGSGESTGADENFTVADLAQDVAAVCDHAGVRNAAVVGLSLGSAVAQELALARPDLFEALVLVATWSSTAREHHIRRHFESRLYALEHGPIDVFAQFAFWMSSPHLYDHEPELQADVERQLRAHTSQNLAGTAQHFRADLTHETRDRLGQVGCRCLVVHGEDDLITLPWYNRTVANLLPAAQLVTIARAGHLVWLERPEELNRAIEAFLSDGRRVRPEELRSAQLGEAY
ncbi:MAG TPA: alpha/beta hydrolase [Mycobacteriales bacterium]|nr:alpha/beta hydrolase [Mycobacteriales bacterium]